MTGEITPRVWFSRLAASKKSPLLIAPGSSRDSSSRNEGDVEEIADDVRQQLDLVRVASVRRSMQRWKD
jgi:hypothetical protein